MISRKEAHKKLKKMRDDKYSSGTMHSTLDKAVVRPVSTGSRTKPKPRLDELDKYDR